MVGFSPSPSPVRLLHFSAFRPPFGPVQPHGGPPGWLMLVVPPLIDQRRLAPSQEAWEIVPMGGGGASVTFGCWVGGSPAYFSNTFHCSLSLFLFPPALFIDAFQHFPRLFAWSRKPALPLLVHDKWPTEDGCWRCRRAASPSPSRYVSSSPSGLLGPLL